MIEFDDIRAPFDVYIKDMRDGLKRKISKRSPSGFWYRSDTIATGALYRSLRTVVKKTENRLTLNVVGKEYWHEADTGRDNNSPIPIISDLERWSIAKKVPISAKYLKYKLIKYGPNRPYSRFATDATPAFIRRLEAIMPGALYRDFTRDVDGILKNATD